MKIKHSRQAHDGLVASFPHGNQFQYKGGKRRCRLRMSPYNQGSIRHLFIVAYRPLSFVYPNTTLAGTARLWYMFLATAMVSHNIKYAERLHKAVCWRYSLVDDKAT